MNNNTIKWWWKKAPPSDPVIPSVACSLKGTDEDSSLYSLPASTRAQHTKSEYSGQFSSDVESTASIISKPWISKNIISPDQEQKEEYTLPEKKSNLADKLKVMK
ncbi:hypothetical protein CU098_009037 [Rhizopus stolonifer]|uniref:Uncharacterized protein n=1 Tax=Rhizopus stolonifer TaxID=4846 RepID=A0A367JCV2_RHIST|nr:hypothetical protein CU098_009037 [Rhizopus stolonifer]